MRRLAGLCLAALALGSAAPLTATANAAPADEARAAHDPEHLLVTFDRATPAASRAAAHAENRGKVANRFDWLNTDVVRVPEGDTPAAAAARYERNPFVVDTDLNWKFQVLSQPNDVLFANEWGLHNTGQTVAGDDGLVRAGKADVDIDAPEGWTAAFGAGNFPSTGGARVGILDTGIDLAHADLALKTKACANATAAIGLIVEGTCSDDNLHGTHVAGTVGAYTNNNNVGVAGVAPNSEFAIFKALDAAGQGFYADVIAGIHWLHTKGGAKIISMSLGGPQDSALDRELSEAYAAGRLLIAAAGNDGDATKNWPAYHPDVMSVSSINNLGERSWFSTCNSDVEIAAPGSDIWSTFPENTYGVISGTSMATPHVSGVAAMVMWKTGSSASQIRSTLKSTAQGAGNCNNVGVVNLAAALGGGGTSEPPTTTTPGAITGKVTDSQSKAALSGAVVDCGAGGRATTGTDGGYTISNVPPSTYTCTASASGYRAKSTNVTVASGATTTASFALRKG